MKLLLRSHSFVALCVFALAITAGVSAIESLDSTTTQFLPLVAVATRRAEFESVVFTGVGEDEHAFTDIQPLDETRLILVRQSGIIQIAAADGTIAATPFLDITDRVAYDSAERGLYELAFHPNYTQNGFFYVAYAHTNAVTSQKTMRISRFTRSASNPDTGDAASEMILLTIPQRNNRHQSGSLAFGPLDGYLYISVGDDNQPETAQQGSVLTGKLLRIDVDSAEPYAIPPDNPFVDDPDVLDEIWALGVRNPWGIDFNPANGDLYIADVGDLTSEELNFQPGTAAGGANYGWPCYEGYEPHDATACAPDAELTAPIYAYGHTDGRCAITGGYVYHGQSFPGWFGAYLFADFCTGDLFTVQRSGGQWQVRWRGTIPWLTTTLGYDYVGEPYAGAFVNGVVYKLLPTSAATAQSPSTK